MFSKCISWEFILVLLPKIIRQGDRTARKIIVKKFIKIWTIKNIYILQSFTP